MLCTLHPQRSRIVDHYWDIMQTLRCIWGVVLPTYAHDPIQKNILAAKFKSMDWKEIEYLEETLFMGKIERKFVFHSKGDMFLLHPQLSDGILIYSLTITNEIEIVKVLIVLYNWKVCSAMWQFVPQLSPPSCRNKSGSVFKIRTLHFSFGKNVHVLRRAGSKSPWTERGLQICSGRSKSSNRSIRMPSSGLATDPAYVQLEHSDSWARLLEHASQGFDKTSRHPHFLSAQSASTESRSWWSSPLTPTLAFGNEVNEVHFRGWWYTYIST